MPDPETPPPRLLTYLKTASGNLKDVAEVGFLIEPSDYFSDKGELLHKIKRMISSQFQVPTRDILVCGSAQIGYSAIKQTPFTPGQSDLDLAIVSQPLFSKVIEQAIDVTRGYTDLTRFARRGGVSTKDEFVRYVAERGMIRPDLLPRCDLKSAWFDFFEYLSSQYLTNFKKISGAIYLSESCFASKQVPVVSAARRAVP